MSEMVGYDGPIYMGHPTKAICPILLEDFRKITVDKRGETNFFTSQMIKDCMKKMVPINLHQTDILISESTYATTIRDSKHCRERDFLKKVHDAVERGGKVTNKSY